MYKILITTYKLLIDFHSMSPRLGSCPVSWDCRIRLLHIWSRVWFPTPRGCPGFDTKQADGEALVMLELWGVRSTPSLPSLPGPLWLAVVAPDRVLRMDQIKLLTFKLWMNEWLMVIVLFEIEVFDLLTVCRQVTDV